MSTFIVENDYDVQSGYCLFKYGNSRDADVYFGNIKFLTKEATIKEYEEWEKETVRAAISLSRADFYPQQFSHAAIASPFSLTYIMKEVFEEEEFSLLRKEDIVKPFFGGMIEDEFRCFINRMWSLETNSTLYDYMGEIREYYRELFRYHINNKKEKDGQELSGQDNLRGDTEE